MTLQQIVIELESRGATNAASALRRAVEDEARALQALHKSSGGSWHRLSDAEEAAAGFYADDITQALRSRGKLTLPVQAIFTYRRAPMVYAIASTLRKLKVPSLG